MREEINHHLVTAQVVDELAEIERVGIADARHHQGPRPVGLLEVDRDAETNVGIADQARLPVGIALVGVVHRRHLVGDRPHHGVTDQVVQVMLDRAREARR